MSCKKEYEKYLNNQYQPIDISHYNDFILPLLMKDNLFILHQMENNKLAELPQNFCKLIVQKYFQHILSSHSSRKFH